MRWRVICADRDTGDEYAVEVEAATAEQARRAAIASGHMVAGAEPAPAPAAAVAVGPSDEALAELARQVHGLSVVLHRIDSTLGDDRRWKSRIWRGVLLALVLFVLLGPLIVLVFWIVWGLIAGLILGGAAGAGALGR